MRSEDAIKALKLFFDAFPNGDKYFIDLSGKGEPLLNKKCINDVSKFAVDESNKLRREVTIQLVTNGTLLNEENVKFLQERNILFGVSLDGNKLIHDLHRKTALGQPTFEIIINNVKKIKNKDYVGCACTLTNDVFDLTAAIIELSNYFKTLSFRLCRGELYSLNQESALKWQKEYETLSRFLIKEIELGNSKIFKCLINGDDMFGRYLYSIGRLVVGTIFAGIHQFGHRCADGYEISFRRPFGQHSLAMGKNHVMERRSGFEFPERTH